MPSDRRYRFVLIEETDQRLPVRYRRARSYRAPPPLIPEPNPMQALLEAFALLDRRGEGSEAWAPVLADNPIAFLLDALEDAVLVREVEGRLLYRNRAARRLTVASGDEAAPRTDHRRMRFRFGRAQLELEIIQVRE